MVEITRIIGSKKADYAHAVLVKHKVIKQGKRGRPAKDSVPPVISSYLNRRALSFAKWCAGWGFGIGVAGHAIRENTDGPVLDAVRRDFPGCYVRLHKLKAYPDYVHPPQCRSNKLEAKVIWDDGEHCYRAEQIENSCVRGFGLSMESAIKNLKISRNFGLMLVRLTAGCGYHNQFGLKESLKEIGYQLANDRRRCGGNSGSTLQVTYLRHICPGRHWPGSGSISKHAILRLY